MSNTDNKENPKLNGEGDGIDMEVSVDPNNPLESKKSFEELGLREEILKGVYAVGYEKPSRIQSIALPSLLRGDNFVGQSQSGTGKTAAFSLSILGRIDKNIKKTQALCICPTRELAQQIEGVIKSLAQFTDITIGVVISGTPLSAVTDQVVIGTPGKLSDFVKKKDLNKRPLLDLSALKILIVDEADEIIGDVNSNNSLWKQTSFIKKFIPKNCQIGVFSATFPDEVVELVHQFVPAPRTSLRLKTEELSIDKINQFYLQCSDEEEKYKNLVSLFRYITAGSTIIFTATRDASDKLKEKLKRDGHDVALLHGKLEKEAREQVMQDFREHRARILISTNLISRGIDVSQVTLILNFDLPTTKSGVIDYETYLHRIGRSGRFGKSGIAINFVHDKNSSENIKKLEAYFKKEISEFKMESVEQLAEMLSEIA